VGGTDALRVQDARFLPERLHFGSSYKRLERGTFTFPARIAEGVASVAIDVHELAVLLEGIEVDELKTKPRWEPTPAVRSTLI